MNPPIKIEVNPGVLAMRDEALAASGLIGRVGTAEENAVAVEAQVKLSAYLKAVEDSRASLKAPVLKVGREIDALARDLAAAAREELNRVSTLLANYQAMEQARQRAAEAARMDELTELERERQTALAAAKTLDEQDEINADFCARAAQIEIPPANREQGQIVREDWEVEVTSLDLLYRSHPWCVKMEPRLREIKELLSTGVQVPGVKARKTIRATVSLNGPKCVSVLNAG